MKYNIKSFESDVLNEKFSIDDIKRNVHGWKQSSYKEFEIIKNEKKRIISGVKRHSELYEIQSLIKNNFLDYLPLSEFSYGYRKDSSYYQYLEPHVGNKSFLRLDIKSFFDSINSVTLKKVIEQYIEQDEDLADCLLEIFTKNGKLTQGAITSPALSNLVFRQFDIRIFKYCSKLGITYSRYVDDLLFSVKEAKNNNGQKLGKGFVNKISSILIDGNFRLNYSKIKRNKEFISLNGFVLGSDIHLSRKKLSRVKTIFYCFKNDLPRDGQIFLQHLTNKYQISFTDIYSFRNYIAGYRSFLISQLPFDSAREVPSELTKYSKRYLKYIDNCEKILLFLEEKTVFP